MRSIGQEKTSHECSQITNQITKSRPPPIPDTSYLVDCPRNLGEGSGDQTLRIKYQSDWSARRPGGWSGLIIVVNSTLNRSLWSSVADGTGLRQLAGLLHDWVCFATNRLPMDRDFASVLLGIFGFQPFSSRLQPQGTLSFN